jgi:hypothetical protein
MFNTRTAFAILAISLLCSNASVAQLRDPTQPSNLPSATANVTDSPSEQPLVLSAIWLSATSKRAVINGVTVSVGDSLLQNTVKILGISRNVVIVSQNGRKKILHLLQRPYQTR